jgi:signal transduction histidine kinase
MARDIRRQRTDQGPWLAAWLHDVSAGVAVGVGLLKGSDPTSPAMGRNLGIEVLEAALADLKQIPRSLNHPKPQRKPMGLAAGLRDEARRLGLELELEVVGEDDWLAPDQAELLRLAGREAIRNVKRHSGAPTCRMTIDLSDCPFVLRVRDWGAGLEPGAEAGQGIARLRDLASSMGCDLAIGSQPGMGTVLVLMGPRCPHTSRKSPGGDGSAGRPRSVVAEESLSSRRRVAGRRPIGASEQQIT